MYRVRITALFEIYIAHLDVILVELEVTASKAFITGGAENLISETPKMLEQSGWDVVKPAIATTVR